MYDDPSFALPTEQPTRDAMLCVRLTTEEHSLIHDFARQHNLQTSRMVRHFILQAIHHHLERKSSETLEA